MGLNIRNHPEYPEYKKDIHLSCRPLRADLIGEETSTKVSIEYANSADVFSTGLAFKLPKHTGITNCAIELINANKLIRSFKSSAGAPIFFDQKSDGFF